MRVNNIYISSNAFLDKRIDSIFTQCERWGITSLELGSAIHYDSRACQKVRTKYKSLRILLHNYFPAPIKKFVLNLGARDRQICNISRILVKRALELSAQIRTPFYGVHAGFAYHAVPSLLGKKQTKLEHFPLEECYEIFGESVYCLSKTAKRLGVQLLIENNVVEPYNLIDGTNKSFLVAGVSDSLTFFKECKNLGVGMLLDVGHLNVSSRTLTFSKKEYITKLSLYIKAFHLSENDGVEDTHFPLNKKSWFLPYLKNFKNTSFTIEVNNNLPGAIESTALLSNFLYE